MDRARKLPRFIAVEGPMGVGKSLLAKRLAATFNYHPLLESTDTNPFLERFYRNPKEVALATQLSFLFQRAQKIQTLRQGDLFNPFHVCDFLMEKDRLFAEQILARDELELYQQAYSLQTSDIPAPDLVIYLQASVGFLKRRIQQRAQGVNQLISTDYLRRINEAYARFFHFYDRSPLLIINATEIDLTHSEQDYRQLVDWVLTAREGRHFFNPRFRPVGSPQ